MIKYSVYLNGGKFLFEFVASSPLTKRKKISIKGGKFKILRATRKDIVSILNGVPPIAVVRPKK